MRTRCRCSKCFCSTFENDRSLISGIENLSCIFATMLFDINFNEKLNAARDLMSSKTTILICDLFLKTFERQHYITILRVGTCKSNKSCEMSIYEF